MVQQPKREKQYSTDEEKEGAKVIKLTTGSFVNSDLSRDRDREKNKWTG